jgi:YVTN family beta-propeller protein
VKTAAKCALAVCVLAGLAVAQNPTLAVSLRGDNVVNLYSVTGFGLGLTLAKAVPVGKAPGEMCLAPNGKLLFVSNTGDKTVSMIDVEAKSVTATLSSPDLGSSDGCSVSQDSRTLYSIDPRGAQVIAFSVESKQQIAKIPVGKEPRRAITSPDGKRVIISNAGDNSLSVIDPATNRVIKTVKTGWEPRDMAYSPDGKMLAVGMIEDDSVEFFHADTLEHIQESMAARSPQHIEFSPDGKRLYVVGKLSDEIGVLRITDHGSIMDNIPVAHGSTGATDSWGMAMTPDGHYLYVTNIGEGLISTVDTETMKTFRSISAGKVTVAAIYIKPTGGITAMSSSDRMAHYRTLAQQAVDAVAKNDLAAARTASNTLEQDWDNGENALRQSNAPLWNQIDAAMDDFIHSITQSGSNPDVVSVKTAQQNFLAKLNLVR